LQVGGLGGVAKGARHGRRPLQVHRHGLLPVVAVG
jgi:hypothetical protein